MTMVGKRVATIAIAALAILIALLTWQSYVLSPWTRNGIVRVQVASIAPQISGQIVDIRVVDNQFVRKGEVLYVIDKFDFEVAMRTAKATLDQRAADLELRKVELERRLRLSDLATTPEEQQTYASAAAQSKAAFDAAQQQLAQAELNLARTTIVSPVNGYVTNLLLRVGDYAPVGARNLSIVDSDSFWVDGYFEETKMGQICIGDYAEVKLMGYADPIAGHARTITRGISVSNSAAGSQGLPTVDPIYTWVRLAQRVPVRIAIDNVPSGIALVSGMTATITMQPQSSSHPSDLRTSIADRLYDLLHGSPTPRPGCLKAEAPIPPSESLAIPKEPPPLPSQKIQPDIAPGMTLSPSIDAPALPRIDPPTARPRHQGQPPRHQDN
ncbi:efflux RND transporter periplasmic adaptor subunit [Tardiphaga sp. 866_E4_N2_1]|uniref:efflux RND transporter periplasmic adaptor subunit n=1 Tax=unclassified Tardiphaga TaxID=2631404 RepID=UPI003F2675FC